MAVVVDDRHAAELVHLEAPAGAGEARERRRGLVARHAGELERRERRARVQPVVLAGQRELAVERRRVAHDVRRAGEPARRTPRSSSASDANSVWWSSSTFVTTAISAGSAKTVRSDSSPSTTSQPAPEAGVRAELRHGRADQPRRVAPGLAQHERDHRGGRPLAVRAARRRSTAAAATSSREELAAPQPGHRRVRRRDDRLPARRARPARARSRPRTSRERLEVRRARRGPSRRPRRPTRARAARTRESPAPPIPTNQSRRPFIGAQARSARRRSRRRRPAARRAASPRPSARRRGGSSSSERTSSGTSSRSSSRTMIAPPARTKCSRVRRLVVAGRERIRHEDRRLARRRRSPRPSSPTRASTRSARGVARRRSGRSPAIDAVVVALHARAARARSRARPVMCRIAGPDRAPRLDDELVQRPRAGERAERRRARGPSVRQLEDLARLRLRHRLRARRDRPADDARLRAVARRRADRRGRARCANGAASRFASPRCASASVERGRDAHRRAPRSTIGPATKPPPPRTTSGRRAPQDRAAGARRRAGEQQRAQRARATAAAGSR